MTSAAFPAPQGAAATGADQATDLDRAIMEFEDAAAAYAQALADATVAHARVEATRLYAQSLAMHRDDRPSYPAEAGPMS